MEHAGSGQLMVVSSKASSFFLRWILHSVQGFWGNTSPRVGLEVRTTEFVLSLEVRGHLLGTGVAGPIAVVFRDL